MTIVYDFTAALAERDRKRTTELQWDLDRHERAIATLTQDRDALHRRLTNADTNQLALVLDESSTG